MCPVCYLATLSGEQNYEPSLRTTGLSKTSTNGPSTNVNCFSPFPPIFLACPAHLTHAITRHPEAEGLSFPNRYSSADVRMAPEDSPSTSCRAKISSFYADCLLPEVCLPASKPLPSSPPIKRPPRPSLEAGNQGS